MRRILGIESSCDETAVALYDARDGTLVHALHSQVAQHAEWGGVVPELAARDHVRRLTPLYRKVLADAGVGASDLDAVAWTRGPGLPGALMVGAAFGRSLAWALDVPSVGVHHMEGHLLAPMLEPDPPEPPFVALLVSGGHTLLVGVEAFARYHVLGETLDDAAGEAFDKTARLLGLPYPGGPVLAQLAETGDETRVRLPRPMTDRPGLDFSFSGLKTAVLHAHHRLADEAGLDAETVAATSARDLPFGPDLAASFQAAVAETLAIKAQRALAATGYRTLVVSGGVGANRRLREELGARGRADGFRVSYPRLAFCTDNAAMIAYAGYRRMQAGQRDDTDFSVRARWPLAELPGA